MKRCKHCSGAGYVFDPIAWSSDECYTCEGTGWQQPCPNHVGARPEATELVGARLYCTECAESMRRFLAGEKQQSRALEVTL